MARLTNILTEPLFDKTPQWIVRLVRSYLTFTWKDNSDQEWNFWNSTPFYGKSVILFMKRLPSTVCLFTWFQSNADKKFQRQSHKQIGTVKKCKCFGCSFGRIGVIFSPQSVSRSVPQERSDPWSDHRISKRSIASHDMLITLTLINYSTPTFRRRILFAWSTSFSDAAEIRRFKKTHCGRTFKHWNWNPASDTKTQSRECT